MANWNKLVVQIGERLQTKTGKPSKWTVIAPQHGGTGTRAYATCRCDCGKTISVRISAVRAGKSIGCNSCAQVDRRDWPKVGEVCAGHRILNVSHTNQGVHVRTECINCGHKCWKTLNAIQQAVLRERKSSCKKCLPWRQLKPDMLGRFISAHIRRNWPLLSIDALRVVMQMDCFYCGAPPANVFRSHWVAVPNTTFLYQGVDEVSYKQGHILGNILPCCIICNKAKNNHTLEAFCAWYNRRRAEEHQLTPEKIITSAQQLGERLKNRDTEVTSVYSHSTR